MAARMCKRPDGRYCRRSRTSAAVCRHARAGVYSSRWAASSRSVTRRCCLMPPTKTDLYDHADGQGKHARHDAGRTRRNDAVGWHELVAV